ncbi:hypothetical protein ACH5RR_024664 [Cinchona calisaya]|uniref:Uncharacterized protein n=1 Tax=Cinchona calisaya TaxID=153742 RepID=A0ABD2YXD7_9GENT
MSDEEWVKVATADDTVVAELLISLKQVKQPPPAPPLPPSAKRALSFEWSVRQRRSKAVLVQSKKQAPRASPTTPLSWSGGATSLSGVGGRSGSGGSVDVGPEEEESSRLHLYPRPPKRSDISRSKITGTGEATTSKRSRKKKTLAELKGEEDLLQKERRQLKRELATLRLNLEKERARNANFKRIKLEMHALPVAESGQTITSDLAILGELPQKMASVDPVPALLPPITASNAGSLQSPPANSCSEGNKDLTVAGSNPPVLQLCEGFLLDVPLAKSICSPTTAPIPSRTAGLSGLCQIATEEAQEISVESPVYFGFESGANERKGPFADSGGGVQMFIVLG